MRSRLKNLLGRGKAAAQAAAPDDGFRLTEPLDDVAVRQLYDEQVLSQEFYGDAYVPSLTAFVSEAAEQMAGAIADTFRPQRVLDVGCGLGQLVVALRRLGVDAIGCDYSEAFVQMAPEEVRPYLTQADVTDLGKYATDAFDAVICMEVLEHLPVDLVHRCVDDLRRISSGPVVVTTPSFGPNWPGRSGLPLNTPEWRADALAGSRFAQIVIAPDGRPHHGHLTLAAYSWWTDLFAGHGLVRNRDVENAWLEDPMRPLWHHRWNPYLLHEIVSADIVVGVDCTRHINYGWNPVEHWDGRAVRWTSPRAALTLRAPCDGPVLRLEVWAGPSDAVYPRELEVLVDGMAASARRQVRLRVEPDGFVELTLDGVEARTGDLVTVTLSVPEPFRPSVMLEGSHDGRSLGVALRRIGLHEAEPARAATASLREADPPVLVRVADE